MELSRDQDYQIQKLAETLQLQNLEKNKTPLKSEVLRGFVLGGEDGTRTHDLLTASQAL